MFFSRKIREGGWFFQNGGHNFFDIEEITINTLQMLIHN